MRPINYTVRKGRTIFHYPFSFLRQFIALGKAEGNVGMILVARRDNMITYKGFGTIENPRTRMMSFNILHFDLMDGPMPSDDDRLKESKPVYPFKDFGIFTPHPNTPTTL